MVVDLNVVLPHHHSPCATCSGNTPGFHPGVVDSIPTAASAATDGSSWSRTCRRSRTRVAVDVVPRSVAVYGFNLGGYRPTALPAGGGNQDEFGGLTDATFTLLQLLEQETSVGWPS
jgi:hypothetical protein